MKRLILVPVLLLAFCKKKEMVEEQPEPEPVVVYYYSSVSKVPSYNPKDYRDTVYFNLKLNGQIVNSSKRCILCSAATGTNVTLFKDQVKGGDKIQLTTSLVSYASISKVNLGIVKASAVNANKTINLSGDSNFNVTARDTVIGSDSAVVASNTWEFVIP